MPPKKDEKEKKHEHEHKEHEKHKKHMDKVEADLEKLLLKLKEHHKK